MLILRKLRSQAGDTIVEVLMCMAIISLVLGGAYAMVNHSTKNSQQASEHGQALKLAEGQLEVLKTQPSSFIATPPTNQFCFNGNQSYQNTSALNAAVSQVAGGYAPQCKYPDISGTIRYWVTITEPTSNTFIVHITWDGIVGGKDKVELAYKVY